MFEPRPDQVEPAGDWRVWLYRAGRGAGKTATGAHTVNRWAQRGVPRILIGGQDPTAQASRIIFMAPIGNRPRLDANAGELLWPNGMVGVLRRGDDPEGFEGFPGCAWLDELFHWPKGEECFDALAKASRLLITATPREGDPLIRRIMADLGTVDSHASTMDNADNLDPTLIAKMRATVAAHPGLDAIKAVAHA